MKIILQSKRDGLRCTFSNIWSILFEHQKVMYGIARFIKYEIHLIQMLSISYSDICTNDSHFAIFWYLLTYSTFLMYYSSGACDLFYIFLLSIKQPWILWIYFAWLPI